MHLSKQSTIGGPMESNNISWYLKYLINAVSKYLESAWFIMKRK